MKTLLLDWTVSTLSLITGDGEESMFNTSNGLFKVSCYKNGNKLLMMCANSVDKKAETKVSLKDGNIKILDAAVSCGMEVCDGSIVLSAEKFDYAVILAEKIN